MNDREINPNQIICGDCMDVLPGIPSMSVDLVMFSPPYALKTRRYPGARRKMTWQEWSCWMSDVVWQCCRVSRGFVIVVANNPVKGGRELPATDKLRVLCEERGIRLERPIIWHKNSTPNRRPWWVNCWEPVMAFYDGNCPRPSIWNWQDIATAPKFTKGGAFRQRSSTGERKKGGAYPQTKLTRPRDVWYVTVGGGHMGSRKAHDNEAPYPEGIVEPTIKALTNPGAIVLDPFVGSGTTCAVAKRLGRNWIGIDVRPEQVALAKERLGV